MVNTYAKVFIEMNVIVGEWGYCDNAIFTPPPLKTILTHKKIVVINI